MAKREYPLFLIDRSKSEAYPFDYIACMDRTVGFVARAVFFPDDIQYGEYIKKMQHIEHAEYFNVGMKLKKGGIVLVVEDFMYNFELTTENKNRVRTLLKKAFKKYLHAEIDRTPHDDLSIDNQIIQQELTVDRARSNYSDLLRRANGDKSLADYQIALAEATLETLRQFRDNQKYFTTIMN